jgi:hypothetical protein
MPKRQIIMQVTGTPVGYSQWGQVLEVMGSCGSNGVKSCILMWVKQQSLTLFSADG